MAKGVFEKMYASPRTADAIVAADGLAQIDDDAHIVALIADVLAANCRSGRRFPRRQDQRLRLPRRQGHEGGGRQGQPETRERSPQARARSVI